ncbi:histone deacetylase complex subunit SAP25 isoform X2 [Lepus europaeus]|uniref:histone deacetylase complex subunit SAP25 isoform X2 n=1 Tax=Lepus europaeus TaxID=9983 RepID=UPI002B4A332D|nr:histone deacetylase complex subunit SAP25 isoform X2 [Lepus europaeus]
MLPWTSPPWGASEEASEEEPGPSGGSDQSEAWSSGEEAPGELGTPPQDSLQPQAFSPSWIRTERLVPRPGLALEQAPGAPVSHQMTWDVAPSRMSLLAPWDPNYQARAGPGLLWGAGGGSGTFSDRTLYHPSLCPLYEASSSRRLRPLVPGLGHWSGEQVPGGSGFPVMCREDFFLSDPLLPPGRRVPLYLSEATQQVMSSQRLLLPPPIMSSWVLPTQSQGRSTTWLSGPELIALTGLLQMSQEGARPSSSQAPLLPVGPLNPAAHHAGPCGSQGCSRCTAPSHSQPPGPHFP